MDEQTRRSRELRAGWPPAKCERRSWSQMPPPRPLRLAGTGACLHGRHSLCGREGLAPCFVRRKWRLRNTGVQGLRTGVARLQSFSWLPLLDTGGGAIHRVQSFAKSYAPYALRGNKASVEGGLVTLSPLQCSLFYVACENELKPRFRLLCGTVPSAFPDLHPIA